MSDSPANPPTDPAYAAYAKTLRERTEAVRRRLRVTKIVATRCIRTSKGDFFCGMSSAWSSSQDSTDLDLLSDSEVAAAGMNFKEDAKIARILLAQEVSIGAHEAAVTEGAITNAEYEARVAHIKKNTLIALRKILPFEEAVKNKTAEAA